MPKLRPEWSLKKIGLSVGNNLWFTGNLKWNYHLIRSFIPKVATRVLQRMTLSDSGNTIKYTKSVPKEGGG